MASKVRVIRASSPDMRSCSSHRRDQSDQLAVVKSVIGHPRVRNERDVLSRFQHRSEHIRPLIDEIQDPAEPVTIVLRHLDDDLLDSTIKQTLNRKELKYVSKGVLEALSVLHDEGFVHTDVKLNNVFVNYKKDDSDMRFSEVQLGDFGGSYHQESKWAKSGTPIGAPVWNSPEVLLELPWNTATDIWSFGTLVSFPFLHLFSHCCASLAETPAFPGHKPDLWGRLQHLRPQESSPWR